MVRVQIEVVMKNKILLLSVIGLILAVPAYSEYLTVEDVRSPEYLKNHGYSEATIEAIEKSYDRVNSLEYEKEQTKSDKFYNKPVIKQVRYFFMNLDPAYDDDSFMNHEFHTSPHWRDL